MTGLRITAEDATPELIDWLTEHGENPRYVQAVECFARVHPQDGFKLIAAVRVDLLAAQPEGGVFVVYPFAEDGTLQRTAVATESHWVFPNSTPSWAKPKAESGQGPNPLHPNKRLRWAGDDRGGRT